MRFPMPPLTEELHGYVEDGLKLCRAGEWRKGLPVLAAVIEQRGPGQEVPGIVYSYLGYGAAKFQSRVRDGIRLCEHAIKLQFYEADNHFNMARVQHLAGERMAAVSAIERGLKLDPDHEGLLTMKREVGVRKKPVLRFLGRENPVNVFLGRVRHAFTGSKS